MRNLWFEVLGTRGLLKRVRSGLWNRLSRVCTSVEDSGWEYWNL